MSNELKHFRTPNSKNGIRLYQYKDGSWTPLGRLRYGKGKHDKDDIESADDFIKSVGKEKLAKGTTEKIDKFLADVKAGRGKLISEGKKRKAAERAEAEAKKKAEEEAKKKPEETKKKPEEEKEPKANDKAKKPPEGPESPEVVNKETNKTNVDFSKVSGAAATTAKGLKKVNEANTVIAKIKNKKQTRDEMASMDNKQLRERIERLNLEQQYSNLTSNRMSKGQERVQNALNIAVPIAEVAASAAAIASIFMKKK